MEKQIPSPIRAGNITMESKGDFPRGVSPKILFTHIKNTAPFIFNADFLIGKNQRYLTILQQRERWLEKFPDATMDHLTYFELCIAAHWATIGTFVPTDVDNQIRLHLWHPELPLETLFAMTDLVEESLHWDFTPVSTRWVKSPIDQGTLGGHHGEWFSISVAAYGALRPRHPERAKILLEKILLELDRELEVFNHFRQVRDGMGALKAATVIAHNTGDFARVMEMWNLPDDDRLKIEFHLRNSSYYLKGAFPTLSILNKQYMALENHRNFALRKPKPIRNSPSLLLPIGPFFDDWGKIIATSPLLDAFDIAEIAGALFEGWVYLETAVGYARALAGMEAATKGGLNELCLLVPAKIVKQLSSGKLRALTTISQTRFEAQWNQFGLSL